MDDMFGNISVGSTLLKTMCYIPFGNVIKFIQLATALRYNQEKEIRMAEDENFKETDIYIELETPDVIDYFCEAKNIYELKSANDIFEKIWEICFPNTQYLEGDVFSEAVLKEFDVYDLPKNIGVKTLAFLENDVWPYIFRYAMDCVIVEGEENIFSIRLSYISLQNLYPQILPELRISVFIQEILAWLIQNRLPLIYDYGIVENHLVVKIGPF